VNLGGRKVTDADLDRAIRWAELSLEKMKQIKDYEAVMVKRERMGDKLRDYKYGPGSN